MYLFIRRAIKQFVVIIEAHHFCKLHKNLFKILLSMVTPYAEEITRYHQRGFRRNRITTDHTFCIRQIPEKRECAEAVPGLIMDPKKASGSVRREVLY